jgi:hypothetical protein
MRESCVLVVSENRGMKEHSNKVDFAFRRVSPYPSERFIDFHAPQTPTTIVTTFDLKSHSRNAWQYCLNIYIYNTSPSILQDLGKNTEYLFLAPHIRNIIIGHGGAIHRVVKYQDL